MNTHTITNSWGIDPTKFICISADDRARNDELIAQLTLEDMLSCYHSEEL